MGLAIATLAGASLLCSPAFAAQADAIAFHDAWYRAPLPGASVTAAYCRMENHGDRAVTLVGFEAMDDNGPRIELHESRRVVDEDGVEMVRMRPLPSMDIAAGATVKLAPGGKHLMVFAPPAVGDLTLQAAFADGSTSEVRFERRSGGGE